MVHLWQHHFGKPSRAGYHNKEWAEKMHAVGLHPSDTGQPGGKETGQQMTHYIAPGGPFQAAFADLDAEGFDALYVELWGDAEARKKRKRLKLESLGRPSHTKGFAELPEGLRDLISESFALRDRIVQLDRAMAPPPSSVETAVAAPVNPVAMQMSMLAQAFGAKAS